MKIEENDIIVDIGANIGFFTVYAHQFNPKKIICLEPDIKSYLTLLENTKNFDTIALQKELYNRGYKEGRRYCLQWSKFF